MSKEEWINFIPKWVLPSLVGIIVSITTKLKKITIMSAITSVILGLGLAYIFSSPVYAYLGETWAGTTLAGIGMFGDRISQWLLFKFKFNIIGDTIENKLKSWIEKM